MAKAKKCIVIGNTRLGYFTQPIQFNSIAKWKEFGKMWFAYRVFDAETKSLIYSGFGNINK